LFSIRQGTTSTLASLTHVDVARAAIALTANLKILGVTLDNRLSFNTHVENICKFAIYQIRALHHIRSSLTLDTTRSLACALVHSRLDHANAILYRISRPTTNVSKLQRVHNNLARVVMNIRRKKDTLLFLMNLHWLPICYCIEYKLRLPPTKRTVLSVKLLICHSQ
jgi:hypothetical protein